MEKKQSYELTGYFGVDVSSYGEQLNGLLFHQTHVGHDVVLSDPRRRAQRIFQHGAVTLRSKQDAAYACEIGGNKSPAYLKCLLQMSCLVSAVITWFKQKSFREKFAFSVVIEFVSNWSVWLCTATSRGID